MTFEQQKARQRYQNTVNNAQGHFFENGIKAGCQMYEDSKRAKIEKTPEPFRVMKKHPDGTFTGRFTSLAQPDFQGTLHGGRSICFEAKYTTTDRMKRSALTEKQMETLDFHYSLEAVAAVCIGIKDKFYFIPWQVWRDMKQIYNRQYLLQSDIEQYRVKFTGAVLFLDYVHTQRRINDNV